MMNQENRDIPRLALSGQLAPHEHVCLIYQNRGEQLAAIIPFLQTGLERGEKCLYFADENPAEAILHALQGAGVNTEDALRSGRLVFPRVPDGDEKRERFNPDKAIRFLEENMLSARNEGASGLRVSYEMTWILKENPPLYLLIEFESRLNDFFAAEEALAICQYNRRAFPPEVMQEAIRTHPSVIFQEMVCENVYYVPPASLLSPPNTEQEVSRLLETVVAHERARRSLRESEERYRRLLSAVTSYTYSVEMENGVTTATRHGPGCVAVTGYRQEDYAENPFLWFSMIHDEDRGNVLGHLNRTLRGEKVPALEHRIIHRDGSVRWIRNTVSPYLDVAGHLVRYDGVVEDITERKRFEAALRESEERFRTLSEFSSDWVYWLGTDDTLLYSSPASLEITGYAPDEFRAKPALLDALPHPEDRAAWEAHRALERSGAATDPVELRIVTRQGESRWVSHVCRPIRDASGKFIGVRGAIRDIAERKRAEQALIQASRMEATATLAGGIAHDFNNLMMSVMGNAELLLMEFPDRPSARTMLEDISRIAGRAGELAHQMLAFARGGKYQLRTLLLNDVLHQTLRNQKLSVPHVHIEEHLAEALLPIQGDPTQIGQVFLNILSNAVEAIHESGRISVQTGNMQIDESFPEPRPDVQPGHYVCVSIEDNGCGMSTEIQSKIFEPFFTTKFQGRGLGLAAAYGIVRNHGGDILVSSEEGRGSKFLVYLPGVEVPEETAPAPREKIPRGTETVLVVDDEKVVLGVTERLLSHLGYRVLTGLGGMAGAEVARSYEGEIHVALIDVFMPDMGGLELIPLIREARPQTKIILCSGYAVDEWTQDLAPSGFDAFLQKPLQLQTLGREIRRVLDT